MNKLIISLFIAAVTLTGCARKDFLYLADMNDQVEYAISKKNMTKIQDNDILKITVSCSSPELAAPFNSASSPLRVSSTGNITAERNPDDNIYRVDAAGDINFPIFGNIHIAGLSLVGAADKIREMIINGNYIKDPVVTIDFENFHYTVLGAAGSNGTYKVDGDKITILEAIANAGDLATNADISNVAVIREVDGKRRVYNVDLRNTDLFKSPAFYLAQNDIVYARPRKPKSENNENFFRWTTLLLSAATATTSIIWVTKR